MRPVLTEFHHVKQEKGAGRRRWFEGAGLELIVWYDATDGLAGFQLCYRAEDHQERALTWRPGEGFSHATVDSGDSRPDKDMTPILVKDGLVPWSHIEKQFAAQSTGLDDVLQAYVLGALKKGAA